MGLQSEREWELNSESCEVVATSQESGSESVERVATGNGVR